MEENKINLVDNFRKKIKGVEELKKSILQKAFSGELTEGESSRMLWTGLEDEQDDLSAVANKAAEPETEYEM